MTFFSTYQGWFDPILRIGIGPILIKISGSNNNKINYSPSDPIPELEEKGRYRIGSRLQYGTGQVVSSHLYHTYLHI